MRRIMIAAAVVMAAIMTAYITGERRGEKRAISDLLPEVDTLYVHDTITRYEPIEVERRVLLHDTVRVAYLDTVFSHDTVEILLPREQRIYADTMYRAVVSGYEPRLDSISIYRMTERIYIPTVEYRDRRFSLGVQAGAGVVAQFGGKPTAGWYVGIGANLTIW